MKHFPELNKDLVEAIASAFPIIWTEMMRCSDREIGVKIGEQHVISFLRRMYDRQQESKQGPKQQQL